MKKVLDSKIRKCRMFNIERRQGSQDDKDSESYQKVLDGLNRTM